LIKGCIDRMVFIEWKLTTALGIVYKDLKRTPSYI